MLFLLTLLLSGMLLSQLIEEKSNKVIEVLAAAVPVESIFIGKLFAMLAMSLTIASGGSGGVSGPTLYVGAMLGASGLLDLIVPRGGKGLVNRVLEEARVPVLAHLDGICHTYVHAAADPDKAVARGAAVLARQLCNARSGAGACSSAPQEPARASLSQAAGCKAFNPCYLLDHAMRGEFRCVRDG